MIIQPNKMLVPSPRMICFNNCTIITTDGPNIVSKVDLSDLNIDYYNKTYARMVLNPQSSNQPVLFGAIGSETTFIIMKFTYDETDPKGTIEEDLYVQYWLADNPSDIRYANKLLLLTGNSTNRIPQIYLNNPIDYTVYVDIFMSNLEPIGLSFTSVIPTYTYSDLYFSNIISDIDSNSGSTKLYITDSDDVTQTIISYDSIVTQTVDYDNTSIILTTSGSTIILDFINEFEMNQANSRILWVMYSESDRYLSKSSPYPDVNAPVVDTYSGLTAIDLTGTTYIYSKSDDKTVMPSDILYYFVSGVTDDRDDDMSISDATVYIRNSEMDIVTGITEDGDYDVLIIYTDNANNTSTLHYTIRVGKYIVINSGETYTISTGSTDLNFSYSGSIDTTASIVISGTTIVVANSGGSFVWDVGGYYEHIFTYIGETIIIVVEGNNYNITWSGYSSLLFGVSKIIEDEWIMKTGYWNSSYIWDNTKYWTSA